MKEVYTVMHGQRNIKILGLGKLKLSRCSNSLTYLFPLVLFDQLALISRAPEVTLAPFRN